MGPYSTSQKMILVFGLCFIGLACNAKALPTDKDELLFLEFTKQYGKEYESGSDEYDLRFKIFKESLDRIKGFTNSISDLSDSHFGINQYSDMTPQEFQNKFLRPRLPTGTVPSTSSHSRKRRSLAVSHEINTITAIPEAFDWRDVNVVSPIKNQGECGACWAISTLESIETMYAIKHDQLPNLSIQQIVDCAGNGNYGCQGGDTCSALSWMNSTKVHIVTEREYPFTRKTGTCKMKTPTKGVQVQNYSCQNLIGKEMAMVELLANHGPLTVAVDATMWQDYLGGIIKYNCESDFNHAVQIVGYNLTGPVPYYIVRNSWGPEFGLNGYLHIQIGKNLCGLATEVATVDI